MEYKDVSDVLASIQMRKARVSQQDPLDKGQDINRGFEPQEECTFSLTAFLEKHPDASCKELTNFTSEELDELADIAEHHIGSGHRGKKCRVSLKGQIFLTLMYFSTYIPLTALSGIVSVKVTTLERIIKHTVETFFPAFINKFIPKTLPPSKVQFKNFPDAVGAVDSSTIQFNKPSSRELLKASWDAKNKVNGIKLQALVNPEGRAIHITTQYLGGTHDKKIFDVSGVTEFVTVKRGVENVTLPILADRGYVGIESYNKTAIVQQRGDAKEIIERNAFIATDRQIVERYFGRLKMSWGILTEGYRGDRQNIEVIIQGLVALTNYLTYLHPLTMHDETKETTEKNDVELHIANDDPETIALMVPKVSRPRYALDVSTQIIGIQNQGLTCHLNAVLQVLSNIQQVAQITLNAKEISPAKEISEIFEVMKTHLTTPFDEKECISTKRLTNVLGREWTSMQDCDDTYEFIIDKINECSINAGLEDNIRSLFEIRVLNECNKVENWLTINLYSNYNDVYVALKARTKRMKEFNPPPFLVINIGRKAETSRYKCYKSKYEFPMVLDLDGITSNDNRQYQLLSIIAYYNKHYIAFNKIGTDWFIIDDEQVYYCEEENISGLFGGTQRNLNENEIIESNPLWIHTNPYKWIAKLLIYKEVNFTSE